MDFHFLEPATSFLETKILNSTQKCILTGWQPGTWKLCFQASRDGFSNPIAHQKCNSKGPTFVITQSAAGYVFGGYTSRSWNSASGIYFYVPSASIFTLSNPSNIAPRKILQRGTSSLYDDNTYGMPFGNGFDFQPMASYYGNYTWIYASNYDFSDFAHIPRPLPGCSYPNTYTGIFMGPLEIGTYCFAAKMVEMEVFYYS